MPPGPIGVTAMKLSLDAGLKSATRMSLGAGLMDFVYCLAAFFATSAVTSALDSFSDDNPTIKFIFQATVIVAIVSYGIFQLKCHRAKSPKVCNNQVENIKPKNKSKLINFLTHKGPFFLGIALALANIANPTFLPSLAYVLMNFHQFNIMEATTINSVIFAVGFGAGNFGWLYVMSRTLVKFRSRLSDRFIDRIHQFAGLTLIGFGTFLGYRVIFPKLIEILRFAFAV